MNRILSLVLIMFLLAGCSTNRVTGRKQLSLVPESELRMMATEQYSAFLNENKVVNPAQSADAAMVKRIGQNIAAVITNYYQSQGDGSVVEGYQWEFNLIESPDINAWCMPGGKVAVYTGILPVTQNEHALAVVMGHEIAHAVAEHGNERMSQGLVQQLGGMALQVALANKPAQVQDIFMTSYGIGSTVGAILPFSRKEEIEADKFGLFFSAMAGYNPQEAIPFWQRMSNAGGAKPPEFLSTHPADDTRIRKLEANMAEAMRFYEASGKQPGSGTTTTPAGQGTKTKSKKIKF